VFIGKHLTLGANRNRVFPQCNPNSRKAIFRKKSKCMY